MRQTESSLNAQLAQWRFCGRSARPCSRSGADDCGNWQAWKSAGAERRRRSSASTGWFGDLDRRMQTIGSSATAATAEREQRVTRMPSW